MLTGPQRAELVRAHKSGLGVLALAQRYSIHRQTVIEHLSRAGVEVSRRVVTDPQTVAEVRTLLAAGQSWVAASSACGLSKSTVRRIALGIIK